MENLNPKVDQFLENLDHPLKDEIRRLRLAILVIDSRFREQIKWNAPSFRLDGADDSVTFNLRSQDRVQLIFHRGAKVRTDESFTFTDETGMLKWLAPDRGSVALTAFELREREADLVALASSWIHATSHTQPA